MEGPLETAGSFFCPNERTDLICQSQAPPEGSGLVHGAAYILQSRSTIDKGGRLACTHTPRRRPHMVTSVGYAGHS